MYYEAAASHRHTHHQVSTVSGGAVLPQAAPTIRKMEGTLEHGLEITREKRWKGKRSMPTNSSSVRSIFAWFNEQEVYEFWQITEEMMPDLVENLSDNYESATVARKLGCFRVVCKEAAKAGLWQPTFEIPVTQITPKHTWFIKAPALADLSAWLKTMPGTEDMGDLITFLFRTGVRVEEALRMTRKHILFGDRPKAKIPGTKTAGSVRLIPLSTEAAALAADILAKRPEAPETPLFVGSYRRYMDLWVSCRLHLGEDDPTCTMKALRRSFAADMVDRGMPVELISVMLGHSDIKTTMGYLRLVGNFMGEKARAWLD